MKTTLNALLPLILAGFGWLLVGCAPAAGPVAPVDRPLAPGQTVTFDLADPDSVVTMYEMAGHSRLRSQPVFVEERLARTCPHRVVGVFFDHLRGRLTGFCLDGAALTMDDASSYCRVTWQRRQAIFAALGLPNREHPWRVLRFEGTTVTCMVGQGA